MQSGRYVPTVFRNTLTKRREVFYPREDGTVKFFTCGPSVYRKQHLGNFRTFLFEDVLQKFLEYQGYSVDRVINFTDVEDKSIAEAQEKGVSVDALVAPVVDAFMSDAQKLSIYLPDEIPRASTSVDQAVELVKILLDKGVAYRHDGNVYYDPLKYDGFGEVFGLDMSRWPDHKVRFSRDTYEGLRWNLGDFILWHGEDNAGGMVFDTELGKGRPAWNLQDAAMITKHLGYEIDIHTGGIDNVYRHHDYNRAIVEAASGREFCHYWMHGEHLIVEGEKMSKSKGNTMYLDDLLQKGLAPYEARFLLIYGYYREKMDITDELIAASREKVEALRSKARRVINIRNSHGEANPRARQLADELPTIFEAELANDLHVKNAVDEIDAILQELVRIDESDGLKEQVSDSLKKSLEQIDGVLGVLFQEDR